ncbi:Protein of unknown function [Zhouia amylolytica]|uniref:DUF4230 domain-containing protein n=1 Tax=Zhouia amylolytica TaxID=376730 RepID=A0A1I6VGX6_9FLAO|nr:DUF4230 domain-containing protein [Zhouia amylolytica]SFT12968.1 Protein of unknown function [Zhouia amylolytica]
MSDIIQIFLGLFVGAVCMYWLFSTYRLKRSKEVTNTQSVVLLEKIRKVCKLVVVEGEFAEIYDHQQDKGYFFGMISSTKRALLIVKAKVHIGFNLQKLKMEADNKRKRIILHAFPEPEVLSFEPNYKFYDIKDGVLNKFKPDEISQLNEKAREFVMDKIPESGLMDTARKEALETILIIQNIVETIGWKLDYSALEITTNEKLLMNEALKE